MFFCCFFSEPLFLFKSLETSLAVNITLPRGWFVNSEPKVRRMLPIGVACLKKAHSVFILYLKGAEDE